MFENTDFSRLLFEHDVTQEQLNAINDVFSEFRAKIDAGESVNHGSFEQKISEAVPQHQGNYHFAESLAKLAHAEGRWEEVFETLYGDMQKFHYMSTRDR